MDSPALGRDASVPIFVNAQETIARLRQSFWYSLAGQDDLALRVFEHESETLAGVRRIQWHISRPRLQRAEHRDRHFQTTLEVDADAIIRSNTEPAKMMSKLVRTRVQVAIAELLSLEYDRRPFGSSVSPAPQTETALNPRS